jgi:hypothetical protein
MKALYVHGESDYSALNFEQSSFYTNDKMIDLWNDANAQEDKEIEIKFLNHGEDDYVFVEALEFKSVDSKFIEFMCDKFVDYDDTKCHNFYIIEW